MGVLWGDHAPSCLGKKGGRAGRGKSHFGTIGQRGVLHVPSLSPLAGASPEQAVCRVAPVLNRTFMALAAGLEIHGPAPFPSGL